MQHNYSLLSAVFLSRFQFAYGISQMFQHQPFNFPLALSQNNIESLKLMIEICIYTIRFFLSSRVTP